MKDSVHITGEKMEAVQVTQIVVKWQRENLNPSLSDCEAHAFLLLASKESSRRF